MHWRYFLLQVSHLFQQLNVNQSIRTNNQTISNRKLNTDFKSLKKEHSLSQTLLGKPVLGSHLHLVFWATSALWGAE